MDKYVLSDTKNGIKVTNTIYGNITPERIAQAKRELAHRLEQLQPVVKNEAEEYRRYREESAARRNELNDFDEDDFNDFDGFDEDDE